ncbi:uncharacterized protein LOC120425607 [Culex pipiens pallens]|uniref:uncharacterized protein LOC120425607 n=1 Tax=Culex pipiens pallens TaxID=42434 RepID=UPI001953AEF7|nr:uncharacterized protein LOC120425607 [Culex pipiens pallens]
MSTVVKPSEHVPLNSSAATDESDYTNQMTITASESEQKALTSAMKSARVPVIVSATGKDAARKKPLGTDFVPPDGGWGWMVVLAAGCSNLCTFPALQQFGLLFRERMHLLDINSSEITTIINTNSALMSIVGLANGPMFRRFSYRQVAFFGASLVTLALFLTSLAHSFGMYLVTFSVLYGSGVGITASANSLALNTYFREKRRYATGFSWTATALGPIIAPHVINYLMPRYGIDGTVLIFAGIAMNAIVCSMLLQPVEWHVKQPPAEDVEKVKPEEPVQCQFCASHPLRKDHSILSSQYLYNADDVCATGYEIIDPGTPMLSRANDGWYSGNPARSHYGSRLNLGGTPSRMPSSRPSFVNLTAAAEATKRQQPATPPVSAFSPPQLVSERKYLADNHSARSTGGAFRRRSNTFNREKEVLKMASRKLEQIVDHETCCQCTCEAERQTLLKSQPEIPEEPADQPAPHYSILQKIVIFFDLDLLKDLIYDNIMVGVTLANFAELNFSVLTPFVLGDFGLTKEQIAMTMSLLGAMDIFCRFFIPFIAGKIGWENRTFFLFGVLNMAFGRIVLAHFHSYSVVLAVACWIGFNKGLRTVFMALAIPSHVPLDRLPGATGIQLLFSGVFYLLMGPLIGFIRDRTNYTVTLHCLNVATYLTALSWGLEMYYFTPRRIRREKAANAEKAAVI